MRVVAGSSGGRRLKSPSNAQSKSLRPTTDRVREAIFNVLSSNDLLDDSAFVDLFAGTGACGIEALSRGARDVTFVDIDRKACALVTANLDELGLDGNVICGDAVDFARKHVASHHVVIADPPYGFEHWNELLEAVDAAVLICESDEPIEPSDRWNIFRQRAYGQTHVTFMEAITS